MTNNHSHSSSPTCPKTIRTIKTICGWPTEVASIDYYDNPQKIDIQRTPLYPHTVLLFIPGNPGCIGWYMDMLVSIVKQLGIGYAIRAASYAGHGIGEYIVGTGITDATSLGTRMTMPLRTEDTPTGPITSTITSTRDTRIAWTIEGQVEHKLQWIDSINEEMVQLLRMKQRKIDRQSSSVTTDDNSNVHTNRNESNSNNSNNSNNTLPRFIFLTHSIGAFLTQQILTLRPNLLINQTNHLIHIMPFIRFDPPPPEKRTLSLFALYPRITVPIARTLSRIVGRLPISWIDSVLERIVDITESGDRMSARELYSQPAYVKNHLELGLREIRELPEVHDHETFRTIAKHSHTTLVFCNGPDQWAPPFHADDIQNAQRKGDLPSNIDIVRKDGLLHDFIVHKDMVPIVLKIVVDVVRKGSRETISRL